MATFDLSVLAVGVEPTVARVWTSPNWATPFTRRLDMIPTMSTWASGGKTSTASIEYRFGRTLLTGAKDSVDLVEITARGYFVLIEWVGDDGSAVNWLGYAEAPVTVERHHGDATVPEAGKQVIPLYGFERALSQSFITTTVHKDPSGGATPVRKPGGAVFNNHPTRGNKSDSYSATTGYVFANPLDTGFDFWSTNNIVEHIFRYHLPTPLGDLGSIPWYLDNSGGALPTWDKPTLATDDRTVADCLNELLSADRLLGWRIEPTVVASGMFTNSPPTIPLIKVIPYTLTDTPVTLPSVGSVPANPASHTITVGGDPLTLIDKSIDSIDSVDQVIVRGPREIAVGTIGVDQEPLEIGWTDDQKTEYQDGAKNEPGFNDLELWDKRENNDRVRRKKELADVYSLLRIKKDWDAGDFFYGGSYTPYLGNCEILNHLPFFDGIDYSGDPTAVVETEGRTNQKPIVLLEEPSDPDIFHNPTISLEPEAGFNGRDGGRAPFSVQISPDNEKGPGVRLNVQGAPPHAISSAFVGNDADIEQGTYGGFSYATIRSTVAIQSDRATSYALPLSVSGLDVVRRKIIKIDHPSLQLVYIQPDTVVGVDPGGSLIKSDGGLLRDPFPLLEALATLAATRQLIPKTTVSLETGRRLPVMPGSILSYLDGVAIGTVINEISISAETAERSRGLKITQTIKASTPGIDILSLMKASR